MIYLAIFFAVVLLFGGLSWLLLVQRIIAWFAKNMDSEGKLISFISSRPGKIFIWRLRMSGILPIVIALFLFIAALTPKLFVEIPIYIVVGLIVLPIVIGFILVQVVVRIILKQKYLNKINN